MNGLFPTWEWEDFISVVSRLCYQQHEGSGFTFCRADVMAMTPREMRSHLEWLDERRTKEADEIRAASRKSG